MHDSYESLSSSLGLVEGGVKALNSSEPTLLSVIMTEPSKEDYVRQLGGDGCMCLGSVITGGL